MSLKDIQDLGVGSSDGSEDADAVMRGLDDLVGMSRHGEANAVEQARIRRAIEDRMIEHMDHSPFRFSDVLPVIKQGATVVVEDDFNRCFEDALPERWNWNAYLYPLWCLGVVLRYAFIFPLRLVFLLLAWLLFGVSFVAVTKILGQRSPERCQAAQRKLISWICLAFVVSWTGVIKYHGVIPRKKSNQIYVANHSSMIDMIILQAQHSYAVVGQQHPGWVGFLQDNVLACLGCVFFDRKHGQDRKHSAELIKKNICSPDANRLLLFPEGTCVNNKYVVQFKKGAFEMGATICPIAIKYNSIFVHGYWNSRKQSFFMHLIRLMTSWAVVCDVWYLEPQTQKPDESAIDFAGRMQRMIAKQAGLIPVEWDGYMKYFRPSARYVQKQQKVFADRLHARFDDILADSERLERIEEQRRSQDAGDAADGLDGGDGATAAPASAATSGAAADDGMRQRRSV